MADTRFLDNLITILGDEKRGLLFPCIRDLAVNGLQLSRMPSPGVAPNRQEATQYLAAWCRFAGMDKDTCRQWLTDYAVEVLSSVSKSSLSRIRHSTKSNIRYIYKDEVEFRCGREGNKFKAECSKACPVYEEMGRKPAEVKKKEPQPVIYKTPETLVFKKKDRYREQFKEAMAIVVRELEKGTKKPIIIDILNRSGFKSRTGRKWNYPVLCRELRKLKEMNKLDSNDLGA